MVGQKPNQVLSTETDPYGSKEISINEVLKGQRVAPFTKENFKAFLEHEMAEENLEFFDTVEEFKETASDSGSVDGLAQAKAVAVKELFIEEDAPKQVNISSDMRDMILNKVETKSYDIHIFDDAENEIVKLMQQGPFKRFLKSAVTENISQTHANWRKQVGIVNLGIAVSLMLSFLLLQAFSSIEILDSRYWRLLSFPFLFVGVSYYQSGKRCVCSALAVQGVYMKKKDHRTWWDLYGLGKKKKMKDFEMGDDEMDMLVQDPYAKEQLRKLGVRYFYESLTISVLSMIVILILPPGDDIYPF